ncbi:gamma-glutamylcyclotransferase family protein [Paenibacillus sp. CAU 1782]
MGDINVFIYGSLLPGMCNHGVIAKTARLMDPGTIGGRLVDCGAYPALVRDERALSEGAAVRGLWVATGRMGLAAMDALEEFYGIEEPNDYERVWVRDASCKVEGGAYVWHSDRGCPSVQADYWPDYVSLRKNRDECRNGV